MENRLVQGSKQGCFVYGGKTVKYIKQRGYFMKDGPISGYFDIEYYILYDSTSNRKNFKQF